MRELAILTFVTLDGVMQAPKMPEEDTSGGFTHGGWADPYWGEVMELVGKEAMAKPYDALLGRRTYDVFAAHQPPEGTPLSDARKYVVTSNPFGLTWQNSVAISGDIPTKIAKLKAANGPLIQVHGSWQLIQNLLAHNLVDQYRLWTFPVVVGRGKRLFANGVPSDLTLKRVSTTGSGVVMTIYGRR